MDLQTPPKGFNPIPLPFLAQSPGRVNRAPARHSHFAEPITLGADNIRGRSRRWGDIDFTEQQRVIGTLLDAANTHALTKLDQAYLLALVRVESGFNPDAAATSSSASGVGQFIDETGKAYGLNSNNRFDLNANIDALIRHFKDNMRRVHKLYPSEDAIEHYAYAYALHHDGPSLAHGGLTIARERVIPWMKRFLTILPLRQELRDANSV